MDDEKLAKNDERLVDSEIMEYEQTVDFRNKCSASGTNNVENVKVKSGKSHSVKVRENDSKSEGSFACSNNRIKLECQGYYQLPEKMGGFELNYRQFRNTINCFASDEESDESSCISSDESRELYSIKNLRKRRRIYEQIILCNERSRNNEQRILFSEIFPEESKNIMKDIQDISKEMVSKLSLKSQCKSSSSCDNLSEKVNTSWERLDLSDYDSLYDDNLIECKSRHKIVSRFDYFNHRNILPQRLDLPGPSNFDIQHKHQSHELKLSDFSNHNVQRENKSPGYSRYNAVFTGISSCLDLHNYRNRDIYRTSELLASNLPASSSSYNRSDNLSPILELSGPSKCKACSTCKSATLKLPGLSNHNHCTKELPRSDSSDSSYRNYRITNILPVLELSSPSNCNSNCMNVSPSLDIPGLSKHYTRRSHKSPRALNFVDSDSSNGDFERTKTLKRKKRRKRRKNISFRSSGSNICKNNSKFCREIYEESSGISDSPKALKRYCAVNTLNDIEGDTLEKINKYDFTEISNNKSFETSRKSRKRLVPRTENPAFEKLDSEQTIYKKLKRSKSSEI